MNIFFGEYKQFFGFANASGFPPVDVHVINSLNNTRVVYVSAFASYRGS